ncbi:MAG: phage head closure protein [Bacteroidales bacterium]|nr:phage head closure protein [Candidatus Scybalousia scybalohippi]
MITELEATVDEDGFKTGEDRQELKVFGKIKSTTYAEFYEAMRAGDKATDVFVINEIDYNMAIVTKNGKRIKPSLIRHENVTYRIKRKFKKASGNDRYVELTCEEVE